MLVLTRRLGNRLFFDLPDGGRIIVSVHTIEGKKVQLAIDSPRDVKILREEIADSSPLTTRRSCSSRNDSPAPR